MLKRCINNSMCPWGIYGTVDFVTSEHSSAQPVPYCGNFILPCSERYYCCSRSLAYHFKVVAPPKPPW